MTIVLSKKTLSMNETNSQFKALLTVKNLIRLLALFGLIFVFCPVFLVSCSGETVGVNVIKAVQGVSGFEDPHPLLVVCILIPIAILIFTYIKNWTQQRRYLIMGGLAVVDIVFWIIFRIGVSRFADDNFLNFKTTPWYFINLIVLVLMAIVTLLVAFNRLEIDKNLMTLQEDKRAYKGGDGEGQVMSDTYVHKKIVAYCNNCGGPLEEDFLFCTACGQKVETINSQVIEEKSMSEETKKSDASENEDSDNDNEK